MKNLKLHHYFLIAIGVIVLDQITKLLVYEYMYKEEYFSIFGDWLKIHYTLNDGMAFGLKIAGDYGKLVLTSFRLVAVVAISFYMKSNFEKKVHPGFQLCVALVLGGAVGNLVDSMFYGVFLDLTVPNAPFALMHGQVIDMIFVDIASGRYPMDWPIVGGDYYSYWPIFNIADSAIFVSVIVILIYQKRFFKEGL